MAGFDVLPHIVNVPIAPFKVEISNSQLTQIEVLIQNAKPDIRTYFNNNHLKTTDEDYGISHSWLQDAKKLWRENYDWRARERRINSFPQFTASIRRGRVHFMALFSKNPKAIPVICIHGWPGCYLEYLGICDILRTKYTPETLPYHVIVPSLPGNLFTDLPEFDQDRRCTLEDSADTMHDLMMALGFGESGYVVSGGDVGAYTSRVMATKCPEVKALHLTFCNVPEPGPEGFDMNELDQDETKTLAILREFNRTGSGYAIIHGTKPATIAAALEAHPFSLLAWLGEKYIAWTGISLPIEEIIDVVLLYWVTNSVSRNLWPYVEAFGLTTKGRGPMGFSSHADPKYYCNKPFGYSFFPNELGAMPKKWVATTGNLVFYGKHDTGGHFAAWENPKAVAHDIEEFVKVAWIA